MIIKPKLNRYLQAIRGISHKNTFNKTNLLTESFLMEQEKNLAMYYAPHNEYIETDAQIVLVGITPGFNQMKTAIESIARNLHEDLSKEALIKHAKFDARLAGQIRNNVIYMLDACGLANLLGIQTSGELFTTNCSLLHTTSIVKYPVFYKGMNYTGHQPNIHRSQMLTHYAYNEFPEEIHNLTNPSIIIPLGKVVDQVLEQMKDTLPEKHIIIHGFPHPSGANGHRTKQFAANKVHITALLQEWSRTRT